MLFLFSQSQVIHHYFPTFPVKCSVTEMRLPCAALNQLPHSNNWNQELGLTKVPLFRLIDKYSKMYQTFAFCDTFVAIQSGH